MLLKTKDRYNALSIWKGFYAFAQFTLFGLLLASHAVFAAWLLLFVLVYWLWFIGYNSKTNTNEMKLWPG